MMGSPSGRRGESGEAWRQEWKILYQREDFFGDLSEFSARSEFSDFFLSSPD
jgi:hypothetical protein